MWVWLALCGILGGNGVMVIAKRWNLGVGANSVIGALAAVSLGWALPGWPWWLILPAGLGAGAASAAILGAVNVLRYRD